MHAFIAFVLIVELFAGFFPKREVPEGEVNLTVDEAAKLEVHPVVRPLSETQHGRLVKQAYDYSCGSAALATVLNYQLGEDFTEKQVIQGLLQYGDAEKIAKRRAFSLLDMKRFVEVLGYHGVGYRAQMEDLKTLDRPGIVPIVIFGYRHFAVFKGIYRGHVFLADPWRGNISFPEAEFENKWYKNVVFIVHPDGAPELKALRLTEEDLRYIDEDKARRIIFDPTADSTRPVDRRIDDRPGEHQIYRRP
jgi:predicted double-glycine peptidase